VSAWRRHLERSYELVELAGTYVEDGALRTAAAQLRKAAERMETAADARDRELGALR